MAEKKKKAKEPGPKVSSQDADKSFLQRYLYYIIIGVFAFLLYANSIGNDYNMDDGLVTHGHKYTSLGFRGIPQILSSPYYSDDQGYAYDYRPVVHLSFAIENQFFGDNPHVGHFFNILLYILCCLVLFRLLRNLLSVPDWVCLAGVLLFAVHPAHTEVVCSLKNRDELLSMLFAFCAFDIYRRFYEGGKWHYFLFGFLLISVSFLSKLSSASYAAFMPIGLLLLKRPQPQNGASGNFLKSGIVLALAIALITALSAVLIQPSVTLGNKFNTLLVLVLPVALVLVIQYFRQIMAWVKSGWTQTFNAAKIRGWLRRKETRIPEKIIEAGNTEVKNNGSVQSYYLFGYKEKEAITNWGSWKPWVLNISLLALSTVPFFFGSLLAIFVCLTVLMASFLSGKKLHRWLAFCVLGIYMIGLFIAIPVLVQYFFPFTAIFFIAYMLHPQKHYSIAAAVLYALWFATSVIFDTGWHFQSLIILIALVLVRRRYGKAGIKVVAVFLLVVVLFNAPFLFPHGSITATNISYIDFINRLVFGVLMIVSLYIAYARIDFIRYLKGLFVLTIAALLGSTLLTNTDTDRQFLGYPFNFKLVYNENSFAARTVVNMAIQTPNKIASAGHELVNTKNNISAFQNKVAASKVELFTVPTDRPLLYLEAPVRVTDPLSLRIGTSLVVLLHYAKLMVLPHPLSFYYGYKVIVPMSLRSWQAVVSLVLYLSLSLLALWNINRNKVLSLGLWGYLLGIALFANFNNLIPGVVGDRYLLFPSVGFCIIIIAAIQFYADKKKLGNVPFASLPVAFKYGFGALLLLLSIKTWSRNSDWKDKITLFRHDIKNVNESAQAHNLLALELMQNSGSVQNVAEQTQMRQEAVEEFKASIKIFPGFFNTTYDLARAYALLNITDSALVYFKKAIPLNPDYTLSHLTIADIYMRQNKWQEAIPYLQQAIKIRPKDYSGYDKLSYVYFMLKDFDSSKQVNRTAIALIPNNAEPWTNLGRTFQSIHQPDSARYYLRKSDAMAPGNPLVQQMLRDLGN